ncbi:unnamed protein product [Closterium sp. NIES-53]
MGRDYELYSLDFSTAFLQGSLHEEIWLRRPPGFTGSFPTGTQWSLRRSVYGLRQAPREWHDTLRTTLATLGFAPSTADPSLFLRTHATLPPFYVLVYVDDLVFATADTEALAHVKSFSVSASPTPRHSPLLCLPVTRSQLHLRTSPKSGMGLVLGGRARVVLTGHADASWVDDLATQRSSQGYTFSLASGFVSWRSTRSSSVLSSSCEAEIYAGAMAAQELRWLTYLLTDLGEAPRSPPVLYVDNKAMLALASGVAAEKPAAPVTRETVAPVAREPVAPVAREPVAPVARESVARLPLLLAAEPVTPVARVPVAPVARVPVAPVARVPVAPCNPLSSSSFLVLFTGRPRRQLRDHERHREPPHRLKQTQATLRRLEAFLTSQPGFATAAAATTATAAPTTPAAVATPTFHGPMAPLSPNLEATRPRLPEAFDPSTKGSDVRRFVATLEIYFEAIGCSTPQHDAARIRLRRHCYVDRLLNRFTTLT